MKSFFKYCIVRILSWQAAMVLRRTKPTIIAITGSVGKTSTKDAVYAVLKQHVHARKSEKSFNSELGVPLTVLGLPNAWNNPFKWLKNIFDGMLTALNPGNYPAVLVLEMGVDRPGDMAAMCKWVKPDFVVLTRLPDVPVHVEYFSSPAAVVTEKMELVEALKPNGTIIYNHDDEQIRNAIAAFMQTAIGFSRYSLSQYTASADQVMYADGVPAGLEFKLTHLNATSVMNVLGSLGVQHAYNYAAAAAVANQLGISMGDTLEALRTHIPPPGRMRIIPGLKDTTLIDDTYNSSPIAAERALLSLAELRGSGRKIAVLGDMLELGQYSTREHEKIGALAARSCDILVTIGVRARKIATGALEAGLDEANILQYERVSHAQGELQTLIQAGDTILIKASQSMRAERIVYELMANPDMATELLVRQDTAWQQR